MIRTRLFPVAFAVIVLMAAASFAFGQSAGLPPAEAAAKGSLEGSPRHGEWVTVDAGAGDGQSGANLKAIQQAWPRMVQFLKQNLRSAVSQWNDGDVKATPAGMDLKSAEYVGAACVCEDDHGPAARTALLEAPFGLDAGHNDSHSD